MQGCRCSKRSMPKVNVGLDVSDRTTSICVLNAAGEALLETSVATDPRAIADALKPYRRLLDKVGHESGCKATWLHKELLRKKLPVVCLDPWHTHAALAANRNKTDRKDARGIAEVLCRGIFTTAYVRSESAQRGRALLSHRAALVHKHRDLQSLVAATLKLAGAKLIAGRETARVKGLDRRAVAPDLIAIVLSTVRAIEAINAEIANLNALLEANAKADPVCRRPMTVPGVGPVTAFSFRTSIDDPGRFKSSRTVAAHFGLTPRTYQSGSTSLTGGISKRGDASVRSLLYQSAATLINISKRECRLRSWALNLRERKGFKRAAIACARRMAVIMHRMWITERDFDPSP